MIAKVMSPRRPYAAPPPVTGPPPTPDDIRAEAAALLAGTGASDGWRSYHAGDDPDPRALYALLGQHRLLAPAWPAAYGGRGLTPHHQAAVVRALVDAGVSETLHTLSVQIAGAFLLGAGSRAQRASILPDLAAGRSFATILYSEPDVGSDLAALTTAAERDPVGGWRVSGRKVYSVKTRFADFGLVAARTSVEDSRYQGISLLWVPLDAPGVDIAALRSIADEQFADVTLDRAWVPDGSVIGEVGHAWPLITEALALERTGVDYHAKAACWLRLWREHAAAVHRRLDSGQRVEVARMSAKIDAAGLLADRCLTQLATGRVDPVLAAMTKLWSADTAREVAWWCADESGPDGLHPASRHENDGAMLTPGGARLESAYREAPGLTISAGTAEMMLEVIAGSGLPTPGGEVVGIDEEPLARALRGAVRAIADLYDERDATDEWWADLARIGAFAIEVPVDDGGLGLGLAASGIVCEELGRGLLNAGALDTFAAIDAYVASSERPDGLLSKVMAGNHRVAAGTFHHERSHGLESIIERDRIRRAAWLVGLSVGALGEAVRRVRQRRQFGAALIEHQSIAFTLARLVTRMTAVRLLVSSAAERPHPGPPIGATVLAEASELAQAATRESMQLCGAWGMTDEAPAQRFYRAAMTACGLVGPTRRLWREADPDSWRGAEHVR